jgi:flagellar basal-body rod protein FlgC
MTLMTAMDLSASGLTAQRKRLEVYVSNLVNADVSQAPGTEPIRRKDVILKAVSPQTSFGAELDNAVQGVEISKIVAEEREPLMRPEPGNPNADKNGMVAYPNINAMEEMVKIMSATRSYEANLQAVSAAKDMVQKTLEILR